MNEDTDQSLCPVCAKNGKKRQLQIFHVNFDESIALCAEPSCTYPIGVEPLTNVLSYSDGSLPVPVSRQGRHDVAPMGTYVCPSNSATQISSSTSPVSVVKSITSPIPSNLNIVSSSPLQSSTLDGYALNSDINDDLPMLHTSFLDDLFDPGPNCDLTEEVISPNPVLSSAGKNESQPETIVPETKLVKLLSEVTTKADVSNTNVVTTASSSSASNLSLESRTITLPSTSQSSSPAAVNVRLYGNLSVCQESIDGSTAGKCTTAKVPVIPRGSTISQTVYPQWKNKDSFCWLDVSMNLLTHCKYLRNFMISFTKDNILASLLITYKKAVELTNDKKGKGIHLETSLGHVVVKTGGGQSPRKLSLLSAFAEEHPLVSAAPVDVQEVVNPNAVNTSLNNIRETLWRYLQPKMRIERGTHDSPVFALPLLLGIEGIRQEFVVSYTWQMVCCHCGHHHEDKVEKIMPTFPNVPSDFSMLAPCFVRSCFKCSAKKQRINMVFDRLPPVVFVHFVEGIADTSLEELDFQYRGSNYRVTGVVQYKMDHFVCWLRHHKEELWMKCDDLEGCNTTFTEKKPGFPTKEVHVVMWEVIGECVHLKNAARMPKKEVVVAQPSGAGVTQGNEPKPVETISKTYTTIKKSTRKPMPDTAIIDSMSQLPSLQVSAVNQQMITSLNRNQVVYNIQQIVTPVSANPVIINPSPRISNSMPVKVMTPVVPIAKSSPVIHQPNAVQPKKTSKKNASDERLQKIRERLEQLKAANGRRVAVKQGASPVPSSRVQPALGSYVPSSISAAVSNPAVVASTVFAPSGQRPKSYLAALKPFLQSKVTQPSMSSFAATKQQFSGYMTKAERASATEAQRKQDEQLALLFSNTKKTESKKTVQQKFCVLQASPKKSVRFTGDSVRETPPPSAKRSLEEPLSSPRKYSKSDHSPVNVQESLAQLKSHSSTKNRLVREQLNKLKIKPTSEQVQIGVNGGPSESNKVESHSGESTNEKLMSTSDSDNAHQVSNDPAADANNIAKEDSVMSELLDVIFGEDASSAQSNVAKETNTNSLTTPDLTLNSGITSPSFDDTDFFSMPSFF